METRDIWQEYKDMTFHMIECIRKYGTEDGEFLRAVTEAVRFIVEYEANNPKP